MVATLVAPPAPVGAVAQHDPTIAEALLVEAGWAVGTSNADPTPPFVVATGDLASVFGNGFIDVSVQSFDLGGLALDPPQFTTPNLDLVDDLEAGDAAWFAGQPGVQLVSVTTELPPDQVDAAIAEIAVGYVDSSREVLVSSAFGQGDPLLGLNTNLSVAGVNGTVMVGHAIVSGGAWIPTSNPLPVWRAYSPDAFHLAVALPITATDIQITLSETRDGTPEGLVSTFVRPAPSSVVIVLDPAIDAGRLTAFEAGFLSGDDWRPAGAVVGEPEPDSDTDDAGDVDPAEDVQASGEGESGASAEATAESGSEPQSESELQSESPASEQVETSASADGTEQTGEVAADAPADDTSFQPGAPVADGGDAASDGSSSWVWLLLLAGVPIIVIVGWLLWWRPRQSAEVAPATTSGTDREVDDTPEPTLRPSAGEMVLREYERTGLGAAAADEHFVAPTNALWNLAIEHPVAPIEPHLDPAEWCGFIVDRRTQEFLNDAQLEAAIRQLGLDGASTPVLPTDGPSPESTTPIGLTDGTDVIQM